MNKDFRKEDKSTKKNIHTQYFEMLFDKENLKNPIFKLSGGAEIFFRKASMDTKREKRHFPREIIKHKRYTKDKLLLHIPIVLNMGAGTKRASQFNSAINERLSATNDIKIIGIDRGEKDLIHYCVIDQLGVIQDEGNFNVIQVKNAHGEIIVTENSQGKKVNGKDYHDLLSQREEERLEARKSWQSITNIKELKEGYIAQVVYELCRLIDRHHAIVVFEDLNSGFKRGRYKVEKQIYQKFEKALIEKLNYLVFKDRLREPGGLLNAYQLTAPFTTFQNMGKQTGIIFYTNANYTSVTDPVTGFRKNIYPVYKSIDQVRKEIQKFDSIIYNASAHRFEFTYNLENWVKDKKELPDKRRWTLCSCVERVRWIPKNVKKHKEIKQGEKILNQIKYYDMTACIKRLLEEKNINYRTGNNLVSTITGVPDKEFYTTFIFYLNLLLQLRNSDTDRDFIESPVYDKKQGKFFHSDNKFQDYKWNGDANGAYNIARKGVIILEKIREYRKIYGTVKKLSWKDLAVSNTDWDDAAQDWEKFVGTHVSAP